MFTPAPGRIALRRLAEANPYADQFAMPQTNQEKSTRCEVVAIPDRPYVTDFGVIIPSPAAVGDHVLIGKYSGVEEKVLNTAGEQEEWMFVRFEEVLAVDRKGADYLTYGQINRNAVTAAEAAGLHYYGPGSTTAEVEEKMRIALRLENIGVTCPPAPVAPATYTVALPSAEDLDRVAEEQQAAEQTKENN